MRRYKVVVTTAADGTATALTPRMAGKVHSVQYIKDGTNPFADGVDFTMTAQTTGESIWAESNVNATAVRYPRAATHSQAGAAALFAAGGTAVLDAVGIVDRVQIAIAQGGANKTGTFHFLVD